MSEPSEPRQLSLPGDDEGPEELLGHDGSAVLHRGALGGGEAEHLLPLLLDGIPWEQRTIRVYGREVRQPRLVAWFGDPGAAYTYSGLTLRPHPWTAPLLACKARCEELAGVAFNSCLANLYRDGQDAVSWHSDNESELGARPVIASLSLGAVRRFHLRHRATKETVRVDLPSGSVLVMSGASQSAWEHQIPRTRRVTGPRVNLTFRQVVAD